MTTLLIDSFPDATLDLSKWAVALTPTGGGVTIQGGRAQLATGTAGGNSAADRVSLRAVIDVAADIEVTGVVETAAGSATPRLYVRSNSTLNATTGYYLGFNPASATMTIGVGASTTPIGSAAWQFTAGTRYRFRFRAVGTTLQARMWVDGQTEPATWAISTNDSTVVAAGYVGFTVAGGAAAASQMFYIDNILITDGQPNQPPAVVVAPKTAHVTVGLPTTLTVDVSDDSAFITWLWSIVTKPSDSNAYLAASSPVGGTPTSTEVPPVAFTADTPGTYILACKVTDDQGMSATSTTTLTAAVKPKPGGPIRKDVVAAAYAARPHFARFGNTWIGPPPPAPIIIPPTPVDPTPVDPTPPPPPPAGLVTVWSEEFTGTGALDLSKWIYRAGTSVPGGPVAFGTWEHETNVSPAGTGNLWQDGQYLHIKATKDGAGNWTSGRIESARSDFRPKAGEKMRVEASINLPSVADGTGYWPAFWMLAEGFRSDPASWPNVGELDIMESVNQSGIAYGTMHAGIYAGGPWNETTGVGKTVGPLTPSIHGNFHTYALEWDRTGAEEIRWYVDTTLLQTLKAADFPADMWARATAHGYYIILNLAMGGVFPDAVAGPGSTMTSVVASYNFAAGTLAADANGTGVTASPVTLSPSVTLPAPQPMNPGTDSDPVLAFGPGVANSQGAYALTDYAEITITPAAGRPLTLTNLTFRTMRAVATTGSDIRAWGLRSSLDNYATEIGGKATALVANTWEDQSVTLGAAFANRSTPVTFRLYVATGVKTRSILFDKFAFTGSMVSTTSTTTPSPTTTSGGEMIVDYVRVSSTSGALATAASTDTLNETFAAAAFTATWQALGNPTIVNGTAQIPVRAYQDRLDSVGRWNWPGLAASVHITAAPVGPSSEMLMQIAQDFDNTVTIGKTASNLLMRSRVNGVLSDLLVPWNATAMAYWQITVYPDGSIAWQTAPDGQAWTTQRIVAAGAANAPVLNAAHLQILAGHYGPDPDETCSLNAIVVAPSGAVTVAKPSASTTGVPVGTTLTAFAGNLTIAATGNNAVVTGAGTTASPFIVQGLDIAGRVAVNTANVIVRKCKIRGRSVSSNDGCIVVTNAASANVLIEDCEIVPDYPSVWQSGVQGHDFTLRRCNIYNCVDTVQVFNTALTAPFNANVTVEDCYFHDYTYYTPDPNHSDNITHNDGVQILGGNGVVIRRNNIQSYFSPTVGTPNPPQPQALSGVLFSPTTGTKSENHVIEDNWIGGGMIPVNCGGDPGANLGRMWRNRFDGNSGTVATPKHTITLRSDQTCDTGDGSANQNVFDGTYTYSAGTPVTVRHNG